MASVEKRSQHLDDTTPLSCFIETSHVEKDHVEYNIRVQRGVAMDNTWLVAKRYTDFANLDSLLRVSNIDLPLPPKKVFGNMERDFIIERQQKLNEYLTALLNHPLLAGNVHVKKYLDPKNYSEKLQETALQHVSMHFRSEPGWEVCEPLPDTGLRLRKQHFLVKSVSEPSKLRYVMYWTNYGPHLNMPEKELSSMLKLLQTLDHPLIYPVTMTASNPMGVMVMHPESQSGSLRDYIHKVKPKSGTCLKKYCDKSQYQTLPLSDMRSVGRQVLEALKFLYDKNIPYGHLHAGNIMFDGMSVRLTDIENSLIGLPSCYRDRICQFKKIDSLEACDVYGFGHLIYEMQFGEFLVTETLERLPNSCPQPVSELLESILTKQALKTGLPSIQDLINNSLFSPVYVPNTDVKFKIPTKVKDCLKSLKEYIETKLKEDQALVHQVKRRSKAQAKHEEGEKMEKKKKRVSKQSELDPPKE